MPILPKILISQFVFWTISMIIKNPTIIDVAWEVNHLLIGWWLYKSDPSGFTLKNSALMALLFIYTVRLGLYILFTRVLPGQRDPRYEMLAKDRKWKNLYFLYHFMLQGFFTLPCALPLLYCFRQNSDLNWNFWLGTFIISVGIIGEAIADMQLYWFKKGNVFNKEQGKKHAKKQTDTGDKEIYRGGLWKKSRHPNLFFDIMTWFGFAVVGLQGLRSLMGFSGPIILLASLLTTTIPITEKYMKADTPNWEKYVQETNKLIPV